MEAECVRERVYNESKEREKGTERVRTKGRQILVFSSISFCLCVPVVDLTDGRSVFLVACFLFGCLDAEGLMGMEIHHSQPALQCTWTPELH